MNYSLLTQFVDILSVRRIYIVPEEMLSEQPYTLRRVDSYERPKVHIMWNCSWHPL
jgi:hypothetical protein